VNIQLQSMPPNRHEPRYVFWSWPDPSSGMKNPPDGGFIGGRKLWVEFMGNVLGSLMRVRIAIGQYCGPIDLGDNNSAMAFGSRGVVIGLVTLNPPEHRTAIYSKMRG